MNDEIKEILDRLERIDHKEYSGGFEFADSSTFDEGCRCFEERKKLADYITNLQQENERLKAEEHFFTECGFTNVEQLALCYVDYKSRIDKAINFINDNAVYKKVTINQQVYYNEYIVNQALNILRGDKE